MADEPGQKFAEKKANLRVIEAIVSIGKVNPINVNIKCTQSYAHQIEATRCIAGIWNNSLLF